MVGEEGSAWSIAKHLLTIERLGIAEVAASKTALTRLKRLATRETIGGVPLIEDPYLLAELAALEAELDALEATEYRFLFDPSSNGELGAEASILKIAGTLIRQRLTAKCRTGGGVLWRPCWVSVWRSAKLLWGLGTSPLPLWQA